ncbi:MAG: glycyl-radical enzyme activating protein [Oscillospiraceae bacterium]|nr:glycyl-radical enzyme activating protein [Oscillospiraceae bacterium]
MEKKLTGKTYDIQGFSVQDGPGIRTTVFLKGCPLRCPWCHSPESQAFESQLAWMAMRCIGTQKCEDACVNACKLGAISYGELTTSMVKESEVDENGIGRDRMVETPVQKIHIDRKVCTNCGDCAAVCHPDALYMCGTDYTVEEIVERVSKDKPFYDHSGGGVTVSGGEAMSQPDFTIALLKALKEKDINTALDTTGYCKWELLEKTVPYADLYLYDLKHMDNDLHKRVVGVPNEIILENAKKLAAAGGKLQVRIPVIPQFNDSKENIRKTGEFCCELEKINPGTVTMIQLLPYHNLGVMKWQRIQDDIPIMEAVPPTDEYMQELKTLLEDMGLPVCIH